MTCPVLSLAAVPSAKTPYAQCALLWLARPLCPTLTQMRRALLFASILAGCSVPTGPATNQDAAGASSPAVYAPQLASVTLATLVQQSAGPATVTWDHARSQAKFVTGSFALSSNDAHGVRQFLRSNATVLGLTLGDFALTHTRQGLAGVYLRLLEHRQGLPVFGSEIIATVDRNRRLRHLNLATLPIANRSTSATATISSTAAISRATQAGGGRDQVAPTAVLGWRQGDGNAVLVYRVTRSTSSPAASYQTDIDAHSGAVLQHRDINQYADGTGMVFDSSPIASSGDTTLTDNNDATSTALDAQRFAVTLPNLDGTGVLRGTFADVRSAGTRANNASLAFNFNRSQSGFEEVNAYFHLNRAQQRIQALGFSSINNRAIIATVNDGNADNSFYSPVSKQLSFGAGGVDDAEDADIVLHEYGHSIQDDQVPGYGGGDERAMGEGFGDYLAVSFAGVLANDVAQPPCVGDWDAEAYARPDDPPCLRRTDGGKHFPEDVEGEVHADGEMWSGALWAAQQTVGADVMNRLVLEAHFALSSNESFFTAAAAILNTDQMLFAGTHIPALRRAFYRYGLSRDLQPWTPYSNVVASETVSIEPAKVNGRYIANADDVQTITRPGALALRLHFATLATQRRNSCFEGACDSIYLYDGHGDLFQILNGTHPNFTSVQVPGDTVIVRLVSDRSVQAAGYLIDRVDQMGGATTTLDAFVAPDAPPDAMVDAAPDATLDAAPMIDAGPDAARDAGTDAASDAGLPPIGQSNGCCQTGAQPSGWWLALGVVGLLRRRRRV